MITLKVKAYTLEELQMMCDVLGEGVAMITSVNCDGDCRNCKYKRPCRDLEEAQEWLGTVIKNRKGK